MHKLITKYTVVRTGCWIWNGSVHKKRGGYGQLWYQGKNWQAHRFFYTWFVGEIPKKLVIDHLCRNTRCVNPEHLEVVNHVENTRRGRKTKLTIKDVEKIKSLYKPKTMIQTKLAEIFKVNQSEISRVINNKRFALN